MVSDLNVSVNVVAGPAKRALNETAKATDKVTESLGRAQKSADNVGNQFNKTGVKLNKFGKGVAQQLGYQIADFSVQVQNGTSAMQAFGQQGSQMLAVFGPIGSLLGAGVAIGSALATTFMGMGRATESAKDAAKELDEAFSDLASTYNTSVKSSLESARDVFGEITSEVTELLDSQRKLATQTTMKDFADKVEGAFKAVEGSSKSVATLFKSFALESNSLSGAALRQHEKSLSKFQTLFTNKLGLTGDAAKDATDNLRGLFNAFSDLRSGKLSLDQIGEASTKLNKFREGLVAAGLKAEDFNKIVLQLALSGAALRSEERRVGKEGRSRWSPYH